jgi:hypothetical protein
LAFVDKPQEKKYNFVADKGKFINELRGKELPFVFFFYNQECIANIDNAQNELVIKTIANLNSLIKKQMELASAPVLETLSPVLTTKSVPNLQLEKQIDDILAQQQELAELERLQNMT